MDDLELSIARLRQWTAEYDNEPPPVVDRELVHKQRRENVFVSRFERLDADHPDDFIAQLQLDPAHPFFFEHPLDHVPGLMLVEAGRQLGTAVAHVEYGVPLGSVFILNSITVEFETFAELARPVFVTSKVREKERRRGTLTTMLYAGHFVQDERPIGFMSGRWHMYSRRAMERLRRAALKRETATAPGLSGLDHGRL